MRYALSVMLMAAACSAPARAEDASPLNEKVVEFARSQLGEKVGDGDCYTLAAMALRRAGASRRFPIYESSGDFVWGDRVGRVEDARPGDIVQFRDAVFDGQRWVTRRRRVSWHQEFPHHTAIVARVEEGGKVLVVLHQNVGPHDADEAKKRVVQEASLRMDSLQKGGSVSIFRPVPVPPDVPESFPGSGGRPSW